MTDEPVAIPYETLIAATQRQRNAMLDAAAVEHAADVFRRDHRIAELEAEVEAHLAERDRLRARNTELQDRVDALEAQLYPGQADE